jgi:hypothetical protein
VAGKADSKKDEIASRKNSTIGAAYSPARLKREHSALILDGAPEEEDADVPQENSLLTLAVAMSVVSPIEIASTSDASIAGVVVRDIHVAFKEWRVPTPARIPTIPLATSDGAILVLRTDGQPARPS